MTVTHNTNEDIIGRSEINDIDAILAIPNADPNEVEHVVKNNADTIFTWDYSLQRPALRKLYEKAKTGQWNGTTDLPWHTEVDVERTVAAVEQHGHHLPVATDSLLLAEVVRRAEAALEHTHEELQRSARFSADASHQLKTPVTVLRAGLEELLARENLSPDECQQLSALVHQTYRLSSVIEDLLLLSRLDAGRLQLAFAPLDLAPLLAASLDDLGAVPDSLDLAIETERPATTEQPEQSASAAAIPKLSKADEL